MLSKNFDKLIEGFFVKPCFYVKSREWSSNLHNSVTTVSWQIASLAHNYIHRKINHMSIWSQSYSHIAMMWMDISSPKSFDVSSNEPPYLSYLWLPNYWLGFCSTPWLETISWLVSQCFWVINSQCYGLMQRTRCRKQLYKHDHMWLDDNGRNVYCSSKRPTHKMPIGVKVVVSKREKTYV